MSNSIKIGDPNKGNNSNGSRKVWLPIVLALIPVFGAIIVTYINRSGNENPTPTPQNNITFDYPVSVQSIESGDTIPNARVIIEVAGQAPLDEFTDSNGFSRIFIDSSRVNRPARLIVQANDYQRHTQNIDLRQDMLPEVIRLQPTLDEMEDEPIIAPTNTSAPDRVSPPTEDSPPTEEPPIPTTAATQTLPPPPAAEILSDVNGGMAPLEISFVGNLSKGVIDNYSWDFKDGGTSDEADPIHTFHNPGVYMVELAVSGAGGNDSIEIPIVVAPHRSQPLYLEVWLTEEDVSDFGPHALRWSDSFSDGSSTSFRDEIGEFIIPYLKNETPLAMGEPDVLYLSWESFVQLEELFNKFSYTIYDPSSGDQPPDNVIWALSNLGPLLDEYHVSSQIDTTSFATHKNMIYGIPYMDGFLVPIETMRMSDSNNQAFSYAMWLHLNQS